MHPALAVPGSSARPLHLVAEDRLDAFRADLSDAARDWLDATGFDAALGSLCVIPDASGGPGAAVLGWGSAAARARGRFHLARAAAALPAGDWRLLSALSGPALEAEVLGWMLARYRFDRYKESPPPAARLVLPEGVDAARLTAIAEGEALTRDLINTPAAEMGPDELEQAAHDLAGRHGAHVTVVRGEDLAAGFPLIHAVGRAAVRAPRLIEMNRGGSGPALTLIGKGVCFDTGGLNLKPAQGMALMKKDMGGAATVLGLAHMLMATGADLRLRVLIPAVENAVSGASFRPGDVLRARDGRTIEVNNTDAEGRLVLADALALAGEGEADLTVTMATLTGAARVALGPDLAPFYTGDDACAAALVAAGERLADPLWRMPFHAPYEAMIEPEIADLDNAPKGGFAGSITAALFLRRFAADPARFVHFDIYGWQPEAAPARPRGGVGQGARALFGALPGILAS